MPRLELWRLTSGHGSRPGDEALGFGPAILHGVAGLFHRWIAYWQEEDEEILPPGLYRLVLESNLGML